LHNTSVRSPINSTKGGSSLNMRVHKANLAQVRNYSSNNEDQDWS